jgi:hypothetical protein
MAPGLRGARPKCSRWTTCPPLRHMIAGHPLAAQGPRRRTLRVVCGAEKDLGCTIPACGHVVRQDVRLLVLRARREVTASHARLCCRPPPHSHLSLSDRSRQAEIAKLDVAVGIEQQIGRLVAAIGRRQSPSVRQRARETGASGVHLHVAVKQLARMHVLERLHGLVQNVPLVHLRSRAQRHRHERTAGSRGHAPPPRCWP